VKTFAAVLALEIAKGSGTTLPGARCETPLLRPFNPTDGSLHPVSPPRAHKIEIGIGAAGERIT
jgi:hypothetical protein